MTYIICQNSNNTLVNPKFCNNHKIMNKWYLIFNKTYWAMVMNKQTQPMT